MGYKSKKFLKKYKLPEGVLVRIKRTSKGLLYAQLPEYPGCFTLAENPIQLIQNVTDAILTYFEVPRKEALKCNITYMPSLPSLSELEPYITRRKNYSVLSQQLQFLSYISSQQSYVKYSSIR